jgi:hypothetical protein
MKLIAKNFPKSLIIDRFYVQKLALETLQEIGHRWEAGYEINILS